MAENTWAERIACPRCKAPALMRCVDEAEAERACELVLAAWRRAAESA